MKQKNCSEHIVLLTNLLNTIFVHPLGIRYNTIWFGAWPFCDLTVVHSSGSVPLAQSDPQPFPYSDRSRGLSPPRVVSKCNLRTGKTSKERKNVPANFGRAMTCNGKRFKEEYELTYTFVYSIREGTSLYALTWAGYAGRTVYG